MTNITEHIAFNRAYRTGREGEFIEQALADGHISSDGSFTRRCEAFLAETTGADAALLTHSATGALEAAALLSGVGPGDEVIMPSFTFVTTASAFALRGATPVFTEIRHDTLNLDETAVADAITPRTKAICAVHYAGVACAMDDLAELAAEAGALLIEDAAQALGATFQDRPLGGIGQLAALSFHETKNVTCGEGGALLVNDPGLVRRAEIIRDKGTNRREFARGEVDKYTWVDLGSSFGLSEVNAAFLWAQLLEAEEINRRRVAIWDRYHAAFEQLEAKELVRRPIIPVAAHHNGHLYYLLLPDNASRTETLARLNALEINSVFHYVPLHSSPAGSKFGRVAGDLSLTTDISGRLIRLPLWVGLSERQIDRVIDSVHSVVRQVVSPGRTGTAASPPAGSTRPSS